LTIFDYDAILGHTHVCLVDVQPPKLPKLKHFQLGPVKRIIMAISRCHSMDFPYAHGNMIFVQHDVWHDVLLAKQCHKPPIWNHMKSYDIIWFSLHPCVQMLSPWGWWIIICFTMLYKPIRWYIYIYHIYISYIYISYMYIYIIYIIYI
jgi:hypothetical protein